VTAAYDVRRKLVAVKWQNKALGIKTFTVQRSDDNKEWKDIALQSVSVDAIDRSYYFSDTRPAAGENYYRVKCIYTDERLEYSSSIMVMTGQVGSSWVMYPVPVTTMLNLQYKGAEPIKGVINVLIQMFNGRIITRYRAASSSRTITIPVDNLGKGIYDVRIIIENEIVWNQRFVK